MHLKEWAFSFRLTFAEYHINNNGSGKKPYRQNWRINFLRHVIGYYCL